MKNLYMVIVDAGDGSQFIEWHKTMSEEKIDKLGEDDSYQSGDGVQVKELKFSDSFDIAEFAATNRIIFYEDDANEG